MKKTRKAAKKREEKEFQIPLGSEYDWSYSFAKEEEEEPEPTIILKKKKEPNYEKRASRCISKLEIIQTRNKYPHKSFHVKTPRSEVYSQRQSLKLNRISFGSATPIESIPMAYVGSQRPKTSVQTPIYQQASQLNNKIRLQGYREVPVKKAPTLKNYNPFKEEEEDILEGII